VLHADAEGISALDVHPNGRRLATCGTDPQIKIWNLLPILDAAAEADPAVPKLLAALSEHQGSVHVVAFNHSGVLLASGGNDNTVLLYKLHSGAATSKLGASFVNIENWKTVANIRGHSLDVTGLSWSPNDRQLATCSMDGRCACCAAHRATCLAATTAAGVAAAPADTSSYWKMLLQQQPCA
jgi:protein HIRA/HIR1